MGWKAEGNLSSLFENKSKVRDFAPKRKYPQRDVNDIKSGKEGIAVVGSGNFGRAIASKIAQAGYNVYIGSRDPEKYKHLLQDTTVTPTTIEKAVQRATTNIVVFAIPKDFYDTLVPTIRNLFSGKIIIDVSNRNSVHSKMNISQAEYLQNLLPESSVVKAFNVLSAFVLENGGVQGNKEVFYAGNNDKAKLNVNNLIRCMGYIPIDRGSLNAAREIEGIPVRQFPEWKTPLIMSSVIFFIILLLSISKFQICWTLDWDKNKTFGDNWNWERWNTIPTTTINSALAQHAITMLTMCYIPGLFAAYIQLFRGTKYSRFPNWLDQWLRMRKQIGLLMLFSASLHAILSCILFSPPNHDMTWANPEGDYRTLLEEGQSVKEPRENTTDILENPKRMKWRAESFLVAGVASYAFAVILGITSLPSVAAALSWKEFAFVQSKLGWVCLLFAVAHDLFYGWPYFFTTTCYLPPTFSYILCLPLFAITMKIILIIPCVDKILEQIRGGWERKPENNLPTKPSSFSKKYSKSTKIFVGEPKIYNI